MRDKIYYLLDFHKKCQDVIKYSDKTIHKYCEFVIQKLNHYFTTEEQKQLKFININYDFIGNFAYFDIDNIKFDNLDEKNLCDFFEEICFVDINKFM